MINYKIIFIFFVSIYSLGFSQDVGIKGNNKNGNSVSGNIFMGDNLLSEGRVFLISNSKSLTSTFSNSSIINGEFSFENINYNDYTLYVIPFQNYDFFYFPKYLPTYLGDVCNWENAIINNLTKQANHELEIHLKKYNESFYGHGHISGKIRYETSYRGDRIIPISILLLNSEKIPMDFRIAEDEDGYFLFENLPSGTYFLHPEMPGFSTDDVEVNVQYSSNNRVDFRINNNSIEKENLNKNEINPILTKNGLKFVIDENISLPVIFELTDLSGKVIFKNMFSSNYIFISTSNITTGIYLLRARTYNNSIIKTSKVFINNN